MNQLAAYTGRQLNAFFLRISSMTARWSTKLYPLNKALFALDVYFEVKLPDIFLFCHPVGTVLGRESYQDYFVVSQNCTDGGIDDAYPTFGAGVLLTAGALLINATIPANRTVVGRAESTRILPHESAKWKTYFDRMEGRA